MKKCSFILLMLCCSLFIVKGQEKTTQNQAKWFMLSTNNVELTQKNDFSYAKINSTILYKPNSTSTSFLNDSKVYLNQHNSSTQAKTVNDLIGYGLGKGANAIFSNKK